MDNIKSSFQKLIYAVVLYIIGVVLVNLIMDIKMKWSTFFILLFSLVIGHIIRYLLHLKLKD